MNALREQLERESRAYGELRAQAARHEAIAQLLEGLPPRVRQVDLLAGVENDPEFLASIRQDYVSTFCLTNILNGIQRPRTAIANKTIETPVRLFYAVMY